MAAKSVIKTGPSATNATWSDTLKPKTASNDQCTVPSPFTLTWNSVGEAAENLAVESGGGLTATGEVNLGTSAATGMILSIAEGASSAVSGFVTFKSTSATVVTISLGGHALEGKVKFANIAGTGGKYKLESNAKLATAEATECLLEEKCQLDLNGKNVETWWFHASTTATVKGATGTTFTILSAGALEGFDISATATLEGEPSVVFTSTANPASERQCNLGGHAYVAVTLVAFTLVEGSSTTGTFNLNNKAAPGECKGTLTALSNHLVVTSGEAALFARAEVTGTGIAVGTTIIKKIEAGVWEMSANATETVLVAETVKVYNPGIRLTEGTTQTVTTLTCNGTEAEPARLTSTVAGKAATIKTAEVELTGYLRVKDITVSSGVLYLPHGTDLGGNTNIKFEAKPGEVLKVEGTTKLRLAAAANMAVQAAIQAATKLRVAASSALSVTARPTGTARIRVAATSALAAKLSPGGIATVRLIDTCLPGVKQGIAGNLKLRFATTGTANVTSLIAANTKVTFGQHLTVSTIGAIQVAGTATINIRAHLLIPEALIVTAGRVNPTQQTGRSSPSSLTGRVNPTEQTGA